MSLQEHIVKICFIAYKHKQVMGKIDKTMKDFYFKETISCGCDVCKLVDETSELSEIVKDLLWKDDHILKRKKNIL